MDLNHEAGENAYSLITKPDFTLLMCLESEVRVQGIGEFQYILLPPNEHPNPQTHSDIRENQLGPVGLQAPVSLHNEPLPSRCRRGTEVRGGGEKLKVGLLLSSSLIGSPGFMALNYMWFVSTGRKPRRRVRERLRAVRV